MNTSFRLKLKVDIELQIAIAWHAIKRYLRPAVDFAQSVFS